MDDADLTDLIIEVLAEIDDWVWKPEGYASTDVGLFYGPIGTAPDRAVGVRVYMADDDRIQHLSTRRAQIRFRGAKDDPRSADRLAGLAFIKLHGLSRRGGISGVTRLSMAPLGADSEGREERSDNYIITLDNPEASS